MNNERIQITRYESNPEWDNMTVKDRWTELNISSHSDGDIEFNTTQREDNACTSIFFNQTELKQLIEFLQSKVIE